ncbi:hypothetical protein COU17_02515 [Candidatus Kaiserbacteria bacterium CG10_big_fil_rev_8_21_14_0_10_49_17]|uniref:Uncharacterized protein n=1 Tax=Candidatus Kaiserbacteria bacterium CG10_big_fil_rev_8_21_14_0_10_49_17 TaxID=1974609 RepID=A0A2M6WE53_9BACT|nr:MAG: hypothetical protein COU17_02515 [Candidatus Kaiserbacteria bacterium CG10_big_fil_rev_8_21_14_0_10_49_17]
MVATPTRSPTLSERGPATPSFESLPLSQHANKNRAVLCFWQLRAVVEDVRTLRDTSDIGFRAALANIAVLKSMHEDSEDKAA